MPNYLLLLSLRTFQNKLMNLTLSSSLKGSYFVWFFLIWAHEYNESESAERLWVWLKRIKKILSTEREWPVSGTADLVPFACVLIHSALACSGQRDTGRSRKPPSQKPAFHQLCYQKVNCNLRNTTPFNKFEKSWHWRKLTSNCYQMIISVLGNIWIPGFFSKKKGTENTRARWKAITITIISYPNTICERLSPFKRRPHNFL